MSLHIQCGMLKTSAAVRPLHNPTTLIKQIQNLQTIHVKSRTIEMSFNMEMRCVTFYLFTKPLVIISQKINQNNTHHQRFSNKTKTKAKIGTITTKKKTNIHVSNSTHKGPPQKKKN